MRNVLVRLLGLGLLAVSLSGCLGPDPVVVRATLQPPAAPGAPHTLIITVQNRGGGEGAAEVTARLRTQASGQIVAQASTDVDLQAHEIVTTTLDVKPASPGPYEILVDARYPQE